MRRPAVPAILPGLRPAVVVCRWADTAAVSACLVQNVQERDVVFGGAERLEDEVRNTLSVMQGELYVVVTSCITEVIGDDVASVVRPLQEDGIPSCWKS